MDKGKGARSQRVLPSLLRPLRSERELDRAIQESYETQVILFKHSRTCGVSQVAFVEVHQLLQVRRAQITYVMTVQTERKICDAVARILGVRHETPQVIVVDGGQAIWHRSHHEITAEALAEAATAYYLA